MVEIEGLGICCKLVGRVTTVTLFEILVSLGLSVHVRWPWFSRRKFKHLQTQTPDIFD